MEIMRMNDALKDLLRASKLTMKPNSRGPFSDKKMTQSHVDACAQIDMIPEKFTPFDL